MRPPVPSTPSPLARREALRRQLALALAQRDRGAVQRLSTQWVHRHGVAALEPLMLELAGAELLQWWRHVLHEPAAPSQPTPALRSASPAAAPAAPVAPAPSGAALSDAPSSGARVLPFPQASARRRPAPAPAHPGLASLRAWLSTPAVAGDADANAAALAPEEFDRAA